MKRKAAKPDVVVDQAENETKNDSEAKETESVEEENSEENEAEPMETTSESHEVRVEVRSEQEISNPNLFKVLGNQELHNLEALKITSSWVSNATTFSATIDKATSQDLGKIELPEYLKENVPEAVANWFPVQYSVLPTLLEEIRRPPAVRPRDVAIAAPTGSGKTICYVLPVLAAVGTKKSNFLHAVVLVPVQTLATQIVEEFARWNKAGHAKIICLSGANDFEKEARMLASDPPNIIVATPVRLIQHLTSKIPPKVPIDMKKLRYLIVDEADRMGKLMREEWLELVEYLCGGMERVSCLNDVIRQRRAPQKIVLSATLSKDIEELHLWNLFRPRLFAASATKSKEISKEINHVSGSVALPSSISHRLVVCDAKYHPLAVYQQICLNQFNRTIIFVNEVNSSNRLAHVLKQLCSGKFEVDYMSAKLFGKRRYAMLQRFNSNSNRILICSDVLARGTDLNLVDCVINYNLPADDKLFVHRAGRTGRAGREGFVISVGDKDTKRIFIKMLKVTNLWGNTVEEVMEEYQFEKDKESYAKAIESLKSIVETNGDTRAAKRSGFEAKRKSRPTKNGEKPWLKNKNQNSQK